MLKEWWLRHRLCAGRRRHLAYRVVGDGEPDVLFVPTAAYPIDLLWDRAHRRQASAQAVPRSAG